MVQADAGRSARLTLRRRGQPCRRRPLFGERRQRDTNAGRRNGPLGPRGVAAAEGRT